jgi:hypothetical protein
VLGGDLARSARTFRTMAVEDSETSRPVNSATFALTPAAMRTANVTSVASPTCRPPPTNIGRRRSLSRSRLNSRPDREQQEQHADLGRRVDDLLVVDEPERVGPDDHAGQEEGDDRDEPQPEPDVGDQRGADDEGRQLGQVGGGGAGRQREHRADATERRARARRIEPRQPGRRRP